MIKNIARFLVFLALSSVAFAHSVTLHWTPGAPNGAVVDHFKIYRALVSGGPYQVMGLTPASQPSFVNGSNPNGTPLVENQTYCYVVTALSGTEESGPTNEACGIIPTSPNAPVNLILGIQ